MSRIGATISGLERYFLTHLNRLDDSTIASAIRLSTGKRINSPADDPAGFIQLSGLEQRWNVIQQTKQQVDAAATVGAEAQLTLDGVRTQLDTIRSALLLDEEGLLTSEDRTTQQTAIDAALESIEELAKTEINGRRFFDGSVNYRFAGRDSAQVSDIRVYALRDTDFSGTVSSAATQAQVTYNGKGGARVQNDATFQLNGERGSANFEVTKDEDLSDVVDRVNAESHNTGIIAEVSGNDIILTTVDYGTDAAIDVDVTSGSFATAGTNQGSDAVVTLNGEVVDTSRVDGNKVSFLSNGNHVVFELTAGFTGALNPISISDEDVAKFALSTNLRHTTRLAVPSLSTALLGGSSGNLRDLLSGGALSGLGDNTSQALRVVDEALAELTLLEGSVDAFADITVASAASLLSGLDDEATETLNQFNGVDEEEETLLLTKNQSLAGNAVAAISVLQQQQANMLALVRLIAGV